MLDGDVAGSWKVIEAALASGFEPGEIYVRAPRAVAARHRGVVAIG